MQSHRTAEYVDALLRSGRFGSLVKGHDLRVPSSANQGAPPQQLCPSVKSMLVRLGIQHLYSHQQEALENILQGRHTVVATPTASGKSLIYNLAFFNTYAQDPSAHGLYIFPLKALTQDQLKSFCHWAQAIPEIQIRAAVYDGDTNTYQRRKIRQNPPAVIMTNPEMVHLALLPHHHQWADFFSHLKVVVIDEVHIFRGFMGSHMCQVLRRLLRICSYYGSSPNFILSSATLANADILASLLTGLDVTVIDQSGAPQGERHTVLISPKEGPAQAAILLLKAAMARKLRTIVYTQSRKLAELITLWIQRGAGHFASQIGVYRAGLLPEERRKIENDLKNGALLAVVSTSALELGIDIGDLDICILVGYPGSMVAVHQRSGRVGRKGQASATLFIAGQDALDQYFMCNPKAFFDGQAEAGVVNPLNPAILSPHLICAAAELPLKSNESWLQEPPVKKVLTELISAGDLMIDAEGNHIHTSRKRPHRYVDLRSAGKSYHILYDATVLGDINGHRLYHEAHPGAVYFHQSQSYLVQSVDETDRIVRVQPTDVPFYTRVRSDTEVSVLEILECKKIGNIKSCYGRLNVTDQVLGYERVSTHNGKKLGYVELGVPPSIFETEGTWCLPDETVCERLLSHGYDPLGSLHAAEHATIGIMPLLILADRSDIGGLASAMHPQIGGTVIFFYDGIPGGAGLCRLGYLLIEKLLETARNAIIRCDCDSGCPACVHSPKCGSGNQPMDKPGGAFLLAEMMRSNSAVKSNDEPFSIQMTAAPRYHKAVSGASRIRFGVFDVETQRSAQEVGGWHLAHDMRVSCAVVYDALDDTCVVYREAQVQDLIAHLKQLDLVVGFNIKHFDYQVLKGYSDFDFSCLPSLDLLELVHRQLGFRLSLDHLAIHTLNARKSGSGLDALRWWKEGRMDEIISYCQKDVLLTRDLYTFACRHGYLIYQNRQGDRLRVPLSI